MILYLHPPMNETSCDYPIIPAGIPGILTMITDLVEGINIPLEMMLGEGFSIESFVKKKDADIVFIDLHWYVHSFGALYCATICKQALPECLVILGGMTSSVFACEILQQCNAVDGIICGDSEQAMRDIEAGMPKSEISNLMYKENGNIKKSRKTYVINQEDYDSLDFSTYDWLKNNKFYLKTDPENHSTSYTYASAFGLTRTTYPDSKYETYTYDNVGNIALFTDCNENTISYTYDDLYRLIEIEYQDQFTVSYTYDLNSNRIQMDDDAPDTRDYVTNTYDQWNRLLTETRHISQDSFLVTYQYDVASRMTQITYPDSMQILYEYDDLNRITEIKRYIDGQNDEILFDNPQYDVESLLTQFDYGNDIQTTYTYDSRDRPLTIDIKDGATSLLDIDYTYDNNNNITQLINGWRDTNSTWHSETESYSYDGLDRLTSAFCTSWSHTYTYDKAGNRTGKDAITYTVNSVNEVTALSDSTSFTYDDNGNRTQKAKGNDTWDYTYDYANRLIEIEENESTIGEYIHDGDGKRLQKTENNITTTYIYLGINTIYEESSTGSVGYIYGPTGLITKRTTIDQESNTYYYHKDHLGSIRSVTDSSKNVITSSTYRPFGEIEVEEGSERYLYNRKERDNTDLYYYGARYYDSQIGRFIARDLIKGNSMKSQSLNRYSYCLNNPVKYIDPNGLIEDQFSVDGGGTQEEPEITGDPSYDGFGEITIPTSMGDVTIDLDTEEDWGDWDDKAKENQVKEKFRELEQGRQKYREWQAKENRQIRDRYWTDLLDGEQDHHSPSPEMSWLDADFSKTQKLALAVCAFILFAAFVAFTGGWGLIAIGLLNVTGQIGIGGCFLVISSLYIGIEAYDAAENLGRAAARAP
ncbi:MAG: hypothetical protein HXS53_01100 [Theionarchaea archaeon]|nr:hypothetical protein [Theionarchaea archaeon]